MIEESLASDRLAEGFYGMTDPHYTNAKRSHYWRRTPECDALRVAIKTILMHPHNFKWSMQGFGFLRTYLPYGPNAKRFRLNVWHNGLTLPNVSIIHDHPWDFTSWILSGVFSNVRFVPYAYGLPYEFMRIKCGETGGSLGTEPQRINLSRQPTENYVAGDIYQQRADEIHLSMFEDGTVTLNDRVGDTEMPRVFWEQGKSWVDAKPREATYDEIADTTYLALDRWQDEIVRN